MLSEYETIHIKKAIKKFKANLITDVENGVINMLQYNYLMTELNNTNYSIEYQYGIIMSYYITIFK